ncbi:YdgA family protein [Haemophilus haemoglobinophilus]|nr:YdgA family protein [Canicola haemoglobinophilus]
MKKSQISIAILGLFGAVWTSSTWYTGKVAEQEYLKYVENVNQKLATQATLPIFRAEINDLQFKRGFFSSDISYKVDLTIIGRQYEIPFKGKLYHGPITLNDFSFALFSSENEMVKNELTSPWFKDDKTNPLQITYALGYDKRIRSKAKSDVAVNTDKMLVDWAINSTFNTDMDGFGQGELHLNEMSMTGLSGDQIVVKLKEGVIHADLQPIENLAHLFKGTYSINVKDMDISSLKEQDFKVKLKNLNNTVTMAEKEGFVDIGVGYKLDDLLWAGQSFFGGELNTQFKHINASALNNIFVISQNAATGGYVNLQDDLVMQESKNILNNAPEIKVSPLMLWNSKGKIFANLDLALVNEVEKIAASQTILGLFNRLSANVELDKAVIKEFIRLIQIQKLQNNEMAEQIAEETVNELYLQAIGSNAFVVNGDKLTLTMNLEDNKLKFNNKFFTDEEVRFLLILSGIGYKLGY